METKDEVKEGRPSTVGIGKSSTEFSFSRKIRMKSDTSKWPTDRVNNCGLLLQWLSDLTILESPLRKPKKRKLGIGRKLLES